MDQLKHVRVICKLALGVLGLTCLWQTVRANEWLSRCQIGGGGGGEGVQAGTVHTNMSPSAWHNVTRKVFQETQTSRAPASPYHNKAE